MSPSPPAPIFMLPAELISHIFGFAHHHIPRDRSHFRELVRFLTSICGVCSSWRQIALCAARLWSRIVVDRDTIQTRFLERVCECLRAFIERSRDAPLDLTINTSGPKISDDRYWRMLAMFGPQLQRCCRLEISIQREGAADVLPVLSRTVFDQVEDLTVIDYRYLAPGMGPIFQEEAFLKLRTLFQDNAPLPFNLPLSSLTSVSLNGYSESVILWETFTSVPQPFLIQPFPVQCTSLVNLTLFNIKWPAPTLAPLPHLPRLKHLSINRDTSVFYHLTMPALEILECRRIDRYDHIPNLPSLQRLRLVACAAITNQSVQQLPYLLLTISGITTLEVIDNSCASAILFALLGLPNDTATPHRPVKIGNGNPPYVVPYLQKLEVYETERGSMNFHHRMTTPILRLLEERPSLHISCTTSCFESDTSADAAKARFGTRIGTLPVFGYHESAAYYRVR